MEAVIRGFRIVPFERFAAHDTIVSVVTPRHSLERGLVAAVDRLGARQLPRRGGAPQNR